MRPYGTMLPLPCLVNVGETQPPQIAAGGVSTCLSVPSMRIWETGAPAGSPVLCSCAMAGMVPAKIAMTITLSKVPPGTLAFILTSLLFGNNLHATPPEGVPFICTKKAPLRSRSLDQKDAFVLVCSSVTKEDDVVFPSCLRGVLV